MRCVKPSPTSAQGHGHLDWDLPSYVDSMYLPYYGTTFFAFLTLNPPWFGITLLTFFIGSKVYYKFFYPKEWQSMWCHGCNAASVLALFAV